MSPGGSAQLDEWIEAIKKLGDKGAPAHVARVAEPLVDAAVKRTASAGTSPSGVAWKPTKKGERALANAANHITTQALGNLISVVLRGPDVYHQKGLGHAPRRQVIPDSVNVPPAIWSALHKAAQRVFRGLTGGAAR